MCGIVGLIGATATPGTPRRDWIRRLLELSESRGSEASGIAVMTSSGILVAKSAETASIFSRSTAFNSALSDDGPEFRACIGHTRLVTNGSAIFADNNQPVVLDGLAMVHNGIFTNSDDLWAEADVPSSSRGDSDSAAFLALVAKHIRTGAALPSALAAAFGGAVGSASVALLRHDTNELALATNVGSLYVGFDRSDRLVTFGSERYIVERFSAGLAADTVPAIARVAQLVPGSGLLIDLEAGASSLIELPDYEPRPDSWPRARHQVQVPARTRAGEADRPRWQDVLRRCTKCILPESVPFIEFETDGVCSVCREYIPVSVTGDEALERSLASFRRSDGQPDCIMAFSGGRDSAFGLHRLVKDFGMTPLALTYDWGMVTDLARRNQARMCGALGVEHVLVSADIARKRANNLRAWMRRPDLGLVPLLMAGDKQFFLHSRRVAERAGVDLVVFCTNPLEMTYFKSGFAGVRGQRYYTGRLRDKVALARYYGVGFARNPRYLNSSLLDTAEAFRASYFTPHDYVQLFEHVGWDEDEINRTLIDDYFWETDPSTPTTWRIGDGTAPFYNWVYYEGAGFTENDTFRSNQVREGYITRDRALELAESENAVRWDRIREYLELVGVSLDEAKVAVDALSDRARRRYAGR